MNEATEEARQAIEDEEYDRASLLLRPLADAGSAEAQYLIGYLYFTSADVDAHESRQWLERAAAQQYPEAIFHLACWRTDGLFAPPNDETHRTLLIRAAELGSIQAQRDLGCCFATGDDGWPLDPALGRLWYGRAAASGHADAQYNYGLMLLYGEGGPVDPSGNEWIHRAAAQNDPGALHYLKSVTE
jgi:TPR repeat protein